MTQCRYIRLSQFAAWWLLLLSSLPSSALNLTDGSSFVYDIGANGVLSQGSLNAYANMYRLRVNNVSYVGQVTGLSADGREAITSTYTLPNSSLSVHRQLYVSKNSNFARYSEIIENTGSTAQTVSVEIFGNLGSGQATNLVSESTFGNFLITDDSEDGNSGSMPVLMHYHSQINHPIQATHQLDGDQLSWTYSNLSIPANSQRRIIYFIAQTPDLATAEIFAANVLGSPTALFEGIAPEDYDAILNFEPAIAAPEQNMAEAIFLNAGEIPRQGSLSEDDALSHRRAATPADYYAINLTEGQTITLQAAASFDTYLYMYSDVEGSTLIASNDDAQVHTSNSEITYTAPAAATYYIEITSHTRRALGNYSLTVLDGAVNHLPLAYNFAATPQTPRAPVEITFTDFSIDIDGDIEERCWEFGDGSSIQCSSANTVTHTYSDAGRFSVGLTLRDDDDGYSFHSEQIAVAFTSSTTDVILPIDDTANGELSPSDGLSQTRSSAFADRYIIQTPTAGEELVITLSSDDFDGFLYLYDSTNRRIRQNDNGGGGTNAQIRYTPVDSSALLVETTSFDDSVQGSYRLNLTRATTNTAVNVVLEASINPSDTQQLIFVARLPSEFNANFFAWTFGDSDEVISTAQPTASHRYTSSGLYDVTFFASNAANQTSTFTRTFVVGGTLGSNLQPQFTVSPQFGEQPLQTFFSNESSSSLESIGDTLRYIWYFGDGEVSTEENPVHTYQEEGTYQVVLEVFSSLTQQSAAYTLPIVAFDRSTQQVTVANTARERPQVIMAGFDPMLVDLLDTSVKVFAIVRTGASSLQTVRLLENGSDFNLSLAQVATYANGDQRYEAVYTFPRGLLSAATLSQFFGTGTGQFRIQARDQAGQFHAFPNVEIGSNPSIAEPASALLVKPTQQVAVRRVSPQVLAGGFDPILIDQSDTQLTVTALVRAGVAPISAVTLQQINSPLQLPMRLQYTLPNGDHVYQVSYSFPVNGVSTGTVSNFFGEEAGQFEIVATDQAGQSHSYPQLMIGNFLRQ